MKYCHIISVGVSITTNYCKEKNVSKDELNFEKLLHNKVFITELLDFVNKDPKKASAELNALYSYSEKYKVPIDEAYLISTDTDECELCTRVLERYLKKKGIATHIKRVKGYNVKYGDFYEGLVEFLKTIAEKVRIWKDRKIYFNATSGFKPEVSLLVTMGSTLGISTYYRHEVIGDVVEIPPFPIVLLSIEKLKPFIESQSGRVFVKRIDELLLKNNLVQPIFDRYGIIKGYEITPIGKLMWKIWKTMEGLK